MKYMLLLYGNEADDVDMTPEDLQAMLGSYSAFHEQMEAGGVSWSGEALLPTAAATTVSMRDDKPLTMHGPYAETKEQLGGFYVIDVENLDQALSYAAKCPAANGGKVEVRPVMEYDL